MMVEAGVGPRKRVGIVTQTVVLTTTIAAIAVLVAGLAAAPFVRGAAVAEATGALGRLADLTAAYVDRPDDRRLRGERPLARPLERILQREGVSGYLVGPDGGVPPGVPASVIDQVLAGVSVSARGDDDTGRDLLIEGRPAGDGGVILTQPLAVASEATDVFLVRIAAALTLGLLIATLVALVVARRLARPLRAAQAVAHQMAEGEREQHLEPQGPAEVADIAEALNALNAALVTSEGRQREFLLSVSHELRTPLTAVKGYGEAMSDGLLAGSEVATVGDTIAAEATRLTRLVNDLLDLARMGAVDFHIDASIVNAGEIVREAEQVWRSRCAREQVELEVSEPTEPLMVLADAMRIRQIIDNLMENALRVSPQDSTVRLNVHRDPQIAGGPYAVFEVADGGPGLTEDDIAVAFEPGALHERYRGVRPVGTGLGLALVSRLAVNMQGSATVTSAPGRGTSFWVRVPLAEPS